MSIPFITVWVAVRVCQTMATNALLCLCQTKDSFDGNKNCFFHFFFFSQCFGKVNVKLRGRKNIAIDMSASGQSLAIQKWLFRQLGNVAEKYVALKKLKMEVLLGWPNFSSDQLDLFGAIMKMCLCIRALAKCLLRATQMITEVAIWLPIFSLTQVFVVKLNICAIFSLHCFDCLLSSLISIQRY